MKSDLSYTDDGMFTRFLPENKAGETAWREMEKQHGNTVFSAHADSVIKQLKAAGYTVCKAKKAKKMNSDQVDELLDALLA